MKSSLFDFNIFIKDDDFEEIAIETNRYAEQYFENNQNLGTFSRFRKWQNTCASEIKRPEAILSISQAEKVSGPPSVPHSSNFILCHNFR
jgi:hypothetical protein